MSAPTGYAVLVRAALAIVLAVAACVNDHIVRDSAAEGGDTTCAGDECGQGDTAADGAPFECTPCSADADCGDAWDHCVMIDEAGLVCLFACPEAGCPAGLSCRSTHSVDGVDAMQCAPQAAVCDPSTSE